MSSATNQGPGAGAPSGALALSVSQALAIARQALETRQFAVAERLCGQIAAADPANFHALCLLGTTAQHQGKVAAALDFYDRAMALRPDAAEILCNRGLALHQAGRLEEAVASYRRALEINPACAVTQNNLGFALHESGRSDAALDPLTESIRRRPDYADAHYNRGNALMALGRLGESIAAYREALRIQPKSALILNNLAIALQTQGRIAEAVDSFQRSLALQPQAAATRSNLLAALHYAPRTTLAGLFHAHCEFDRVHAAPLLPKEPAAAHGIERGGPIRLGFISPHFASHPVGSFLVRPLENLDHGEFHIVCYSDTPKPDAMTERLRRATQVWRETRRLSDEELTAQIRADHIEILFDLAGQTSGHRLLVFARKAAPVQISWLDYVGTTGLAAMDYLLADPHEIPAGAERWYREKILRMPHDYICFDPPANAPAVNALPVRSTGAFTFGSFNILAKTTPEIVAVWSRVLQRVPNSRMILMNRGFEDEPTAARYRGIFAGHGIDPARIVTRGWRPPGDVLGCYHEIDLALDTCPYNGGLSTCEALWMGVPVITCPGETFCSRHGLTHLSAAGWTDGIARDLDDYVERAVSWTADLPRLAALRQRLRLQMEISPLCDGRRFAAAFSEILRSVWRR